MQACTCLTTDAATPGTGAVLTCTVTPPTGGAVTGGRGEDRWVGLSRQFPRSQPGRLGWGRRHPASIVLHQLGLVGGGHHGHVRQAGEIGDVERAGMGRYAGADQAGAVDREADGQVLDRDVVYDLVVAALQECRVDRAERLEALARQSGAKVTACCSAMPTRSPRPGGLAELSSRCRSAWRR